MTTSTDLSDSLSPLQRSLLAIRELRGKLEAERQAQFEPIAVIGMSCRFPAADSVASFWDMLRDGREGISRIPGDRWDVEAYYDPNPGTPGKMYTLSGGFLGDVSGFDAGFFQISPREASSLDPQQRLLLEVGWEALESSGHTREQLKGSRTGVFVGISSNDYLDLLPDMQAMDAHHGTGTASSVAAGRLSYVWGLQGPCVALDTACSSSLVAVHLACQSLRNRECELALAGGVNVILVPESSVYFCSIRALSSDGRCKTFDANADGYARGEGCGVLVLKRLSAAVRDRDPILALIRGSAVNHDGQSNGLTAPNGQAQEAVIQQALSRARVSPEQVGYVEAHGTGTPLGDPIEVAALGKTLARGRSPDEPLLIGSVKTNFGHLEAAAGVAGMIKTILALKHRKIPAHLNFKQASSFIDWDSLPIRTPTALTDWTGNRVAGVSSFGFGGTNAHVVLEEAPPQPVALDTSSNTLLRPWLLPISAQSLPALQECARNYARLLESGVELLDLCYTTSVRRSHYDQRIAVIGSSRKQLVDALERYASGGAASNLLTDKCTPAQRPKTVFVFSPHGSQWLGMAQDLLEDECFRENIERIERALNMHVTWSLKEVITRRGDVSWLEKIDILQPVLFALQLALAEWYRSCGIEPDAVIGHSMGEIAAVCFAGALSLDTAAELICRRTQLLARVTGQGAMAVVELSLARAREVIARYSDRVFVAVSNSPRSTVLSGDPESLENLLDELSEQGIFCGWGVANVASHTPEMAVIGRQLGQELAHIEARSSSIPIYSSVLGVCCDGSEFGAEYWIKHLNQPVLFSAAVERLIEDDLACFVELAPHPVLLPAIEDTLRQCASTGKVVAALRRERPAFEPLLETLGSLYAAGHSVLWERLYPNGNFVTLPAYPWQRERYWAEPKRSTSNVSAHFGLAERASHPLLGVGLESAIAPGTFIWEVSLNLDVLPYLNEHRVQDVAVLPATAYLEMADAIGSQLFEDRPYAIVEFKFVKALPLLETVPRLLQVVVSPDSDRRWRVQFLAKETGDRLGLTGTFTLHAVGYLKLAATDERTGQGALPALPRPEAMGTNESGAKYYASLLNKGLKYGPSFQNIEALWYRPGEVLADLRVATSIASDSSYRIHPALADATFQTLGALFRSAEGEENQTYLPTAVDSYELLRSLSHVDRTTLCAWARLSRDTSPGEACVVADIDLVDATGQPVLVVRGLRAEALERRTESQDASDWLFELSWQAEPLHAIGTGGAAVRSAPGAAGNVDGVWLVLVDRCGVGQRIAQALQARGGQPVLVRAGERYKSLDRAGFEVDPANLDDYQRLLREAVPRGSQLRGVIQLFHLNELSPETQDGAARDDAERMGPAAVVYMVQALAKSGFRDAPRLWIVTRDAVAVRGEDPISGVLQSPLWGLGRVIAQEHSEFRCVRVDLDADAVLGVHPESVCALIDELAAENHEDQLAFRGGERFVARLTRAQATTSQNATLEPARDHSFRLSIDAPGRLDALSLRSFTRRPCGPGEVEIEVAYAGLNFLDVLSAMGVRPGAFTGPLPLGFECTGRVVSVGDSVRDLSPGDEVVAVASWAFASHVVSREELVVKKPVHMTLEELATVPGCFMTAYEALVHAGRLAAGETVLIHSAAGGTGLAAVQVARSRGARIFATAGSEEKRGFLKELGIDNVMDSRSLKFVDEVLAATGGVGVDVLLNSLPGEAVQKGLSIMAPFGRFVEIGKKDIFDNSCIGLSPFRAGLSYTALDIASLTEQRPQQAGALLREVLREFASGRLSPLPARVFAVSRVSDAFRLMASAQHVGKIVVAFDDEEARVTTKRETSLELRDDACYLITGGLGGLGLATARWLVQHGARHIVLLGRHAPSGQAQVTIGEIQAQGASVHVEQADVTSIEQVRVVIERLKNSGPPLRGIIHAAGVLDDSMLLKQNAESLRAVIAPKVTGTVNVYLATRDCELDFVVFYSSAASLLGSPGQGSYSAANAFLDAMAHYLRRKGVCSLSVNWGPFSDVGLVASPSSKKRFASRGLGSLTSERALDVLAQLVGDSRAQVGVVPLDLRQWSQSNPKAIKMPLLTTLAREQGAHRSDSQGQTRDQLKDTPASERFDVLLGHIRRVLAEVLRTPETQVGPSTPFNTLGLDSLLALEFRNRLEVSLAVSLPATVVWAHPTVAQLARHLLDKLGFVSAESEAESLVPSTVAATHGLDAITRIGRLSDEEVERRLSERLARRD